MRKMVSSSMAGSGKETAPAAAARKKVRANVPKNERLAIHKSHSCTSLLRALHHV